MTQEEAAQALRKWREAPPPRDMAEFDRLDAQLMATCDGDTGAYFVLWLSVMGRAPQLTYPTPSD